MRNQFPPRNKRTAATVRLWPNRSSDMVLLDEDETLISMVSKNMRFEALTSETSRRGLEESRAGSSEHFPNLDWIAPDLVAVNSGGPI